MATESTMVILAVIYPCVLPELHVHHVSRLQQKRGSIGWVHTVCRLMCIGDNYRLAVLHQHSSRAVTCSPAVEEEAELVDTFHWGSKETWVWKTLFSLV